MSEPLDTAAIRAHLRQMADAPVPFHMFLSSTRSLCREIDQLRAEIEFMRSWCADHYGAMPPTREQNAAFMRALDEMEGDRG